MKLNNTFWKMLTLVLAATCMGLLAFTSFKNKPTAPAGNPAVIADRTEARNLYSNFLRDFPPTSFAERGGYIGKSTLQSLVNVMTNSKDTAVYFYFGRTNGSNNIIMLFNDPKYHDLNTTLKFKTITPYCPPDCNTDLNTYFTE